MYKLRKFTKDNFKKLLLLLNDIVPSQEEIDYIANNSVGLVNYTYKGKGL